MSATNPTGEDKPVIYTPSLEMALKSKDKFPLAFLAATILKPYFASMYEPEAGRAKALPPHDYQFILAAVMEMQRQAMDLRAAGKDALADELLAATACIADVWAVLLDNKKVECAGQGHGAFNGFNGRHAAKAL